MAPSPQIHSSDEILTRKKQLVSEISREAKRFTKCAKGNYLTSVSLMVGALGCTVAAAVLGVFYDKGKVAGALSILPPLIAFVAMNLKLDGKASWHYRIQDALIALRSRLLYELPEAPSVDEIAAISEAKTKLYKGMQKEWDDTLALNWTGMMGPRVARRSDEPAAGSPG